MARRPRSPWAQLSRASRQVLLLGVGLMLLAGAALGLLVWQLRGHALAEARDTVRVLGIAVAEQTSRSVQGADVVLQDLRRQIDAQGIDTVERFKARLRDEALFRFLKDRADFLPQVDAFTVIAADGELVNFSRAWPVPPTNLSDRDYVRYFLEHDTVEAIVSTPVQNRGNGTWTSYLVRRVNGPDGQFLGMVLAAVDLDYFGEFFKSLSAQLGMSVTLLRRDGTMLTSYPDPGLVGQAVPRASPWYEIVQAGADVFETRTVGRPQQILAVRPLPDYPLVVNVGVERRAALAGWVRTAQVIGVASLFVVACVVLLVREQLGQFARLERSEAMLADRNALLEDSGRALLDQARELSDSRSAIAAQSATLQAALRHMNQGIIMVDEDETVVVCNERAAAMLDLPAELVGARPTFARLVAFQRSIGEFADPAAALWAVTIEEAIAGPGSYERSRPDGTVLEIQTVPMQGGGMVRTYTDVTERRRMEKQVQFMARHDGLTGLYNRTAFHERFDALIAEAARHRQSVGVFYIDLDGFKLVNDTYGHAVGDELLVKVAVRLRAAVRESDVVARMGGDEFAVIQPFSGSGGNIHELATRMLASVAEPYSFGEMRCSVNLSIGVALYPDNGKDAAELLHEADLALYRAKHGGKGTYRVYDPAIDKGEQAIQSMEQDLAGALGRGELHLDYQPIKDADTLAVRRYEALLRWTHPGRGAVPPSEFIPVAERSGLILPIGLWVLETACAAASGWPEEVGLSVNLSPAQFRRGDLAAQVEQVLARTGLAAARLNLEITEGVLLENIPAVTGCMARLRDAGIRFSLDDFGTAYAGLAYLRTFPFDVLKIDKSFVQDAGRTPMSRDLLVAIHAVATACKLEVVAEGVETEAELALVRELRADHVQGYLLGRPAPDEGAG